nr:hypothetical protein [Streptomyces sp. Mg1]
MSSSTWSAPLSDAVDASKLAECTSPSNSGSTVSRTISRSSPSSSTPCPDHRTTAGPWPPVALQLLAQSPRGLLTALHSGSSTTVVP